MKHPAEFFLKFLVIRNPAITDAQLLKTLDDWGFLSPQDHYLGFLRNEVPARPPQFDPSNRVHRPSMQFLRDQQVYEMFYPSPALEEAWENLSSPDRRMAVEQILLARLDPKMAAQKINKKHGWHLTEDGIKTHGHFFWNVKLLTFDQWGRYLYDRSSMYDRYMSLLQAPPQLAFFHLRLEQTLESKKMIMRAQEIAYFTLEEVAQVPGVRADKIKAIGILNKAITDCHAALSTSDMALSGVLKQFERFRMEHPLVSPPDIKLLAPVGNYTGSGIVTEEKERVN